MLPELDELVVAPELEVPDEPPPEPEEELETLDEPPPEVEDDELVMPDGPLLELEVPLTPPLPLWPPGDELQAIAPMETKTSPYQPRYRMFSPTFSRFHAL